MATKFYGIWCFVDKVAQKKKTFLSVNGNATPYNGGWGLVEFSSLWWAPLFSCESTKTVKNKPVLSECCWVALKFRLPWHYSSLVSPQNSCPTNPCSGESRARGRQPPKMKSSSGSTCPACFMWASVSVPQEQTKNYWKKKERLEEWELLHALLMLRWS